MMNPTVKIFIVGAPLRHDHAPVAVTQLCGHLVAYLRASRRDLPTLPDEQLPHGVSERFAMTEIKVDPRIRGIDIDEKRQ